MHERKKEMDELLARDPEARKRFDQALGENEAFVAMMEKRKHAGDDGESGRE